MLATRCAGIGLAALLVSCATTPPAEEMPSEAGAPAVEATDCSAHVESQAPVAFYGMDRYMAGWEPTLNIVAEAGAVIPINIGQSYGPHGMRPIPLECIAWRTEPADALSVSDDGETLTISADAEPGSIVSLTALIAGDGERSVSATLRISVLDDALRPLMGTWQFEEVRGCSRMSVDPPREVRFEPENRMSVAWTVFERYWDYWGRYEWDAEAGGLSFEPAGGNRLPADVSARGQPVAVDDRHIAISSFHFGNREPDSASFLVSAAEAGCTFVFRRQRGGPQ